MADTLVILGGVVFDGFAIPDKINFGGKQAIKIHKLIGGQRIVNPLGPDPDPITWSAKFRGPSALGMASAVDAMRTAGLPVPLSWFGLAYTVIVTAFKVETEKFYEIPYTVTCEVVSPDGSSGSGGAGGLTGLVGGDLSALLSTPLAAALPAVGGLATLINGASSLDDAIDSVTGPILAAVGGAESAITAAISADDAIVSLASVSGVGGVLAGAGTALASASALQATIAAMTNQGALQGALALVTRIGTNMQTGGV